MTMRLEALRSRPAPPGTLAERWVNLSLSVLLAALFLPGCQTSPLGVASLATPEDSVRYVSQPGTPYAIATIWHNGVVNVAYEVHDFVERPFPRLYCPVRGVAVYRGHLLIGIVTGTLCTSRVPDFDVAFTGGSMNGSLAQDTLSVLALTTVATDCGTSQVEARLVLVRESSQ